MLGNRVPRRLTNTDSQGDEVQGREWPWYNQSTAGEPPCDSVCCDLRDCQTLMLTASRFQILAIYPLLQVLIGEIGMYTFSSEPQKPVRLLSKHCSMPQVCRRLLRFIGNTAMTPGLEAWWRWRVKAKHTVGEDWDERKRSKERWGRVYVKRKGLWVGLLGVHGVLNGRSGDMCTEGG